MKKKILLISNNLGILDSIIWAFGARNYEFLEAFNEDEGFEMMKSEIPDLAIIETGLFREDVFEIKNRMSGDPFLSNLPIIMLVNRDQLSSNLLKFISSPDDFIVKPFNWDELVVKVERIFERQSHGIKEQKSESQDISAVLVKLSHRELQRAYKELQDVSVEMIKSLATALEAREKCIEGHSQRVGKYSALIARGLGWKGYEVDGIETAGILHDIGKIGIPDRILLKPKRFTPREFQIMKEHPVISAEILRPLTNLSEMIPSIRHHHEFFDGGGYPEGLKGEKIPIGARVILVADAYEAMTSDRPYRKAIGHVKAMAELKRFAGTQFDPDIVSIFEKASEQIDTKKRDRDATVTT